MANKKQDTDEKKKERKLKLYIRRFIKLMIKLGILAGVFLLIFKYVFGIHYLRGNYMFPALKDGDLILTYKLEEPVKNDVVLYDMNGEERLGRIVGYAGDTIAFSVDGELMVNGCVASEEIFYPTTERVALHKNANSTAYDNSSTDTESSAETPDAESEATEETETVAESSASSENTDDSVYTVPEGTVYILNDYRTEGTTDSRDLGAVPKTALKGKIFIMLRRRGF